MTRPHSQSLGCRQPFTFTATTTTTSNGPTSTDTMSITSMTSTLVHPHTIGAAVVTISGVRRVRV